MGQGTSRRLDPRWDRGHTWLVTVGYTCDGMALKLLNLSAESRGGGERAPRVMRAIVQGMLQIERVQEPYPKDCRLGLSGRTRAIVDCACASSSTRCTRASYASMPNSPTSNGLPLNREYSEKRVPKPLPR